MSETYQVGEILVSFDVKSLYTKVPIKNTLAIIKDSLENEGGSKTKSPLKGLLEIVEYLIATTCFKFNGNFQTKIK